MFRLNNLNRVLLVGGMLLSANALALSDWQQFHSYQQGQQVAYQGKVYQAKWWTYNEVPGLATWDGVWQPLRELYDYSDYLAPSQQPPAGLLPEQVPMFIVIGSDDNFNYGAMNWLLDELQQRKHADGSALKFTFFNTGDAYWGDNAKAWKRADALGHESGNHSLTHPYGYEFNQQQWDEQIREWNTLLAAEGFNESEIRGFRAGYLSYNTNLYPALKANYMEYDSSIEEGFQFEQDGSNYLWPYTLDHGSPSNDLQELFGLRAHLEPSPGLWELPIYAMMVPDDAAAAEYGIEAGLRQRCGDRTSWFYDYGMKITGLDWNLAFEYGLNSTEYAGVLKYNLDLRLQGNRAPFIFGIHSNYYGDAELQQALLDFIDYALTQPDVRFVTYQELVEWLRNPQPLR